MRIGSEVYGKQRRKAPGPHRRAGENHTSGHRGRRGKDSHGADYLLFGREDAPAPAESAGPAPAETAASAAKPAKSRGRRLWDDYGYLLVTLAAVFVLFKVLLQLAYVPSGSMETTIPTKCLLVGWRLPYVVSDPVPDRGDIVTFWDEELNKVLVKRVVGLPGETLSFKNGYTYVNGEKLDESYLPTQGITTLPDSMAEKTFTVPEGCMFVMGDNRTGSNDSRLLGEPYIPIEAVQARMLVAISVGSDQSWQGIRWIG